MQKTPCHPRWSRGRDAAPSEGFAGGCACWRCFRTAARRTAGGAGGAACHTLRAAPLAATTASWTVSWSAAAALLRETHDSSRLRRRRRRLLRHLEHDGRAGSLDSVHFAQHDVELDAPPRCLNDDEPLPRQHDNERRSGPPVAARRSGAAARASISHPLPTEARALRAPRRANTP